MYRNDSDGLDAARAQLVSYSARLLDDGLAVGSAGNMSVRIGDRVAITPSGVSYTEMRPEDICLVGMDGAELQSSETPSSETPMHLAIYAATKAQAGAGAGPGRSRGAHALARGHRAVRGPRRAAGHPLRDHRPRRAGPGRALRAVRVVRVWPHAAVTALDGRSAVILRNHGAVTYGRDLAQAYDRALLLEWLARTYRLALSYGEPAILSAAELDEVTAESRRRRYGERRSGQAMNPAMNPAMSRHEHGHERPGGEPAWPLGTVTVLGAHILDVLGRPVEEIPPGQGSVRLKEIRATAAGTAAGTGVDLAKLGAQGARRRRARRRPAR